MNEGLEHRTLAIEDSIGISDRELAKAKKQVDDYDRKARASGRYAECSMAAKIKGHALEGQAKARRQFREQLEAHRKE